MAHNIDSLLIRLFEAKPSEALVNDNLLSYRYGVFSHNVNESLSLKYHAHLDFVQKVSKFLTTENIIHFFPKTLIHEGDIGGDIDLHIIGNSAITHSIIKNLSLRPDNSSVLNSFASKFAYTNSNNDKIEIHFSLGSFGELNFLKKQMAHSIIISKYNIPILNDKFSLFFLLIQRGLSHNTIRVTDFLYFKKLYHLTNNESIIAEIKKIGLFRIYTTFCFLMKLEKSDPELFIHHIKFNGFCHKFSLYEMLLNYAFRYYSDLKHFRINGLIRIALSPFIVAATKLFRSR